LGHTVVVVYRPVAGREDALLDLVHAHVPALRALGLATDAPPVILRSPANGNLVEIFDWVSEEAVQRAHSMPEVIAMWDAFDVVCDFLKLAQLAEAETLFAHFERVEHPPLG